MQQSIKVDIRSIKNNPHNPRIIKDDKFHKLVKSIKEFPQMLELRPIVVNEQRIILGGNMRLKAAESAGFKEVPIIIADNLTPEQEKEFIIKDNASFGEWNWDELINGWNLDSLKDWSLDIPDFGEAPPHKDIGEDVKTKYIVEIECENETDQQITYDKLKQKGYLCKVLTL